MDDRKAACAKQNRRHTGCITNLLISNDHRDLRRRKRAGKFRRIVDMNLNRQVVRSRFQSGNIDKQPDIFRRQRADKAVSTRQLNGRPAHLGVRNLVIRQALNLNRHLANRPLDLLFRSMCRYANLRRQRIFNARLTAQADIAADVVRCAGDIQRRIRSSAPSAHQEPPAARRQARFPSANSMPVSS